MKNTLKNSVISIVVFGGASFLFIYVITLSMTVAVTIGALVGILFAIAMELIVQIGKKRVIAKIENPKMYDEMLMANYRSLGVALGGMLLFADDKLEFVSHDVLQKANHFVWMYSDIAKVELGKHMNEGIITLHNGNTVCLVVNERKVVARKLQDRLM